MEQPEQKANELVAKFRAAIYEGVLTTANVDLKREAYRDEQGRRCAVIAVAELINQCEIESDQNYWYRVGECLAKMKQIKNLNHVQQQRGDDGRGRK